MTKDVSKGKAAAKTKGVRNVVTSSGALAESAKPARKARISRVVAPIKVDMSLPISQRPMKGVDIEEWVWSARLTKHEANFALGCRNGNHYLDLCKAPLLPIALEILIRLYYRFPDARGWGKFTTRELYDRLYLRYEQVFEPESKERLHAQVDLGSRFCKLFGRSVARQYEWIRESRRDVGEGQQYAEIEAIMGKLFEIQKSADAAKVFEETALLVNRLRGIDIDELYRVPTLSNPPSRKKVGRPVVAGARKKAAKSPARAAKKTKA